MGNTTTKEKDIRTKETVTSSVEMRNEFKKRIPTDKIYTTKGMCQIHYRLALPSGLDPLVDSS